MKTMTLMEQIKEATEGSRNLDSAIIFHVMKKSEGYDYYNEGNGRITEYGPRNYKVNLTTKTISTDLNKISKYMESLLPNSCFRSGKSFNHRDKYVCNVLIDFYNKEGVSDAEDGVSFPTIIATANTEALSRCLALVMAYEEGYVIYGEDYRSIELMLMTYGNKVREQE